jgi:lipopolysaccharide transport system permease protein
MSVQSAAGLIKKVAFPHELLVYAAVASTYIIHMIGFLFVLLIMKLSGKDIHLSALPVAMVFVLFQIVFTTGLAMLFSALQVFARDVEHFLAPLLMIWFYATPVLYPASLVPPQIQGVMALNPMAGYIDGTRDAMLYGATGLSVKSAILAVVSVTVFVVGRVVFRRLSPHFEDFL